MLITFLHAEMQQAYLHTYHSNDSRKFCDLTRRRQNRYRE